MASPHPPFVSPGSSYYPTQSPPPPSHYNYGPSHAGPSSYPYQYGMPPPHMSPNPGHSSPRMTPRGGYRPRGSHHHHAYHNYAQQQQQHYMPGPMPPPPNENPNLAKFSPSHPTSYAYPHTGPYSPVPGPSWQSAPHQQQQLSPLPKQLQPQPSQRIMSPAPSNNYGHEGIPAFPRSEETHSVDEQRAPESTSSAPQPGPEPEPTPLDQQPTANSSPSSPAPAPAPEPLTSSSPPSSPPSSPSLSPSNTFVIQWAVWSRRPTDPTQVPGLVFSSRSRLPTHIIQKALPDRTPPPSPILESVPLPEVADEDEAQTGSDEGVKSLEAEVSFTSAVSEIAEPELSDAEAYTSSQAPSTAPSSSAVTEATETPSTTVPVSPASSSTSISAATKDGVVPKKDVPQAQAQVQAQTADEKGDDDSTVAGSSQAQAQGSSPVPLSAPAPAPVPPPLKKSWASLLRSPSSSTPTTPSATASTSTSTSTAGSSSTSSLPPRAKIPVSSVVGISIPADSYRDSSSPSSSTIPSVSAAKKAGLLKLLNAMFDGGVAPGMGVGMGSTPVSGGMSFSAAASRATPAPTPIGTATAAGAGVAAGKAAQIQQLTPNDIRPRGLINTGNMCFANSVLQVLLYCPPFFRLFSELGRVGSGGGVGKEVGVETPLVDATVEFLNDFLPLSEGVDERGSITATTANAAASSSANANTLRSNAKGKEREKDSIFNSRPLTPSRSANEMDDSSFIPTYIYDALKEQKRFDHMRGGHQEDAEEFLGFYLDTLEEELLGVVNKLVGDTSGDGGGGGGKKDGKGKGSAIEEVEEDAPPEEDGWLEVGKRNRTIITRTIKSTESPITRIFGGKFRSSLRVPGQKESAIVEDWRSLRLDIQRDQIHTIQEALSYISHPQPVHLTNPPREGSQLVQIEELPPVLILHMKRFHYDASVGGVVKIAKQITFGPELVVGPDVMAPSSSNKGTTTSSAAGAASRTMRYRLFAAIYHHGVSASGGHYTLDVLHPNRFPGAGVKGREGWIRIDDELVSDVKAEDVFDERGEYGHGDSTRCAYLLFYRRVR